MGPVDSALAMPKEDADQMAKIVSRLKDISTLDFSNPSFNPGPFNPRIFNHELFNPELFNHEFLNHGVEKFMVDKPGVEISALYKVKGHFKNS